jgi:hypothetical protein
MAGDWIKMRSNLRRHPKVVRIASALKADRLRVVGALHAVWSLFDEHSIDGQLLGYTLGAIDDDLGFPGLADAMVAIGWLASDGNDGLSLPEFDAHNSASAKRRAQEAERKKAERAASKSAPQDVREASASRADKSVTREEKRREDISSSLRSEEVARKRAAATAKPEGVTDATWADWLQLRKAKKAPVTETVVAQAQREAAKAGMALQRFLEIWCMRGSQGLQADWLRADERQQPRNGKTGETDFQRHERDTVAQFTGGLASRKTSNNDERSANASPVLGLD